MNPKMWNIFTLISISILSFDVSCGRQNAVWQGKIEEKEGVVIVRNPKEPIYDESVFSLEPELSIGNQPAQSESAFSEIGNVIVDREGRIYVSDPKEVQIKVFDNNGAYLRTIGRRGQGPGELEAVTGLQIMDNGELAIFDMNTRRITFYTPEGKFLRVLLTDKIPATRLQLDAKRNFIASTYLLENLKAITEIKIFGDNQNFLQVLDTSEPANIFNPFLPYTDWRLAENGNLYLGYNKNYEIAIFNSEWQLTKKILKDYDPIEISSEEKQEALKKFHYPKNVKIPRFHPAFSGFVVDDQGLIYVKTWNRAKGANAFYYDVFDPEGRYVAKIPLNWSLQICKGGRMYIIEENKEGFQIVKRYKTIWKVKLIQ